MTSPFASLLPPALDAHASTLRPLAWDVGPTPRAGQPPIELVPAQVPGAVQLDWARAEGLPDYWVGKQFEAYRGLEDQYWLYRARLELPEFGGEERLFFVCGGVDYRCRVSIEGEVVHEQEGMFTPFELDLTDRVKAGDALEILVFPAPKLAPTPEDRTQARHSTKPAVSYGWDFHPRLIPLGIWQATGLEVRPRVHLKALDFHYRLSEDFSKAFLHLNVTTSDPGAEVIEFRLVDPEGLMVVDALGVEAVLDAPRLWWPAGEGKPELYTLEVIVNGVLARTQKVGFRRVRLLMREGAWKEPKGFPSSRSEPPITLEINGRVIFVRGSNWVCPEIFPGTVTRARYRELLELASGAHFNLLRTWGGAIVNPDPFYEICDELGLLVWTEFPLACNLYDGGDDYLSVLDRESRSIITRVRQHPSLAFWCGGNELFNHWSGMTDQSLALRLLNKNCYELDRETPFIATAPLGGMGHGDYRFLDEHGREVFQIFAQARCTAYSEFGCPGPASVETLRRIIPEAERFPPRAGTAWEAHHALGAWDMDPGTWLCEATIERYFGPSNTLEELVARGQLLQAVGYQCLFEEARRQKPVSAMALNWCFNEPWPTAANNSLVSWPAEPKPAYAAVRASCRQVLASARVKQFSWQVGETFEAELWILNDAPVTLAAGHLEAELLIGQTRLSLGRRDFPELAPRQNHCAGSVQAPIPAGDRSTFSLCVRVVDRPELDSEYTFVYRREG